MANRDTIPPHVWACEVTSMVRNRSRNPSACAVWLEESEQRMLLECMYDSGRPVWAAVDVLCELWRSALHAHTA